MNEEQLKEELNGWKILYSWGGNPEIIDKFIKGQQMRIYADQEARTEMLEALQVIFTISSEPHHDKSLKIIKEIARNTILKGKGGTHERD